MVPWSPGPQQGEGKWSSFMGDQSRRHQREGATHDLEDQALCQHVHDQVPAANLLQPRGVTAKPPSLHPPQESCPRRVLLLQPWQHRPGDAIYFAGSARYSQLPGLHLASMAFGKAPALPVL